MIHFKYRAWYILSRFGKVVGFWPYQNKMKNRALMIFDTMIVLPFCFGMVVRLIEEWNDNLHIVVENFIQSVLTLLLFIKILTIGLLDKQRARLYEKIATQFESIVDEDEVRILRNYSEKGLIFTIVCTLLIANSIGIYLALPIIRMFYLYFFSHGSLELTLPLYVDFFIDEQDYFFYIITYMFFGLLFTMTVDFTFDLDFFLTVRHICALFEIVKFRLNNASELYKYCDLNNKISNEDEAKAREIITSAVDLHNEASKMTESLDRAYKTSWFFILLLNAITLAPVPVMIMLYADETFELCRRSVSLTVYPLHFYIIFLQGQMTIDHSESIFDCCYNFYWYNASKRSRLDIFIIMTRSLKPCRLTGLLFDFSMETYSVMLKTALSYISMFQALDM